MTEIDLRELLLTGDALPTWRPEYLAHVEVLRVRPGDMVVITHPGPLTMEQASYIKRVVEARLPLPDVPVLVVSDGVTVSVARGEDIVCEGGC